MEKERRKKWKGKDKKEDTEIEIYTELKKQGRKERKCM
jgi:hypothetical protein